MPDSMVSIGERWLDSHVPCREGDMAEGGMVGVGQHLRRTGLLGSFVLVGGGGGEGGHIPRHGDSRGAVREEV